MFFRLQLRNGAELRPFWRLFCFATNGRKTVVTPAARCSILNTTKLSPVFRYLPSHCTDVLISVNPKAGSGARLSMIVLHDDAQREYALPINAGASGFDRR